MTPASWPPLFRVLGGVPASATHRLASQGSGLMPPASEDAWFQVSRRSDVLLALRNLIHSRRSPLEQPILGLASTPCPMAWPGRSGVTRSRMLSVSLKRARCRSHAQRETANDHLEPAAVLVPKQQGLADMALISPKACACWYGVHRSATLLLLSFLRAILKHGPIGLTHTSDRVLLGCLDAAPALLGRHPGAVPAPLERRSLVRRSSLARAPQRSTHSEGASLPRRRFSF